MKVSVLTSGAAAVCVFLACSADDGQSDPTSNGSGGSGAAAGSGAVAGTAGAGAMAGTGAVSGTGGGATCDPAYCPTFGPGTTPCCVTPQGPCGYDFGQGCFTQGAGGAGGATGVGGTAGVGGGSGGAGAVAGTGTGGFAPVAHACTQDPPPGSPVPTAPGYSGGACPQLQPGGNVISSGGAQRMFLLVVPEGLQPSERLPVIFLWHWLGGSASDFFDKADVGTAANTQRFIAVIPEAKGDLLFKWPFEVVAAQPRMDEEFRFFDDMLACVAQQYNVALGCISSAGVSAGGLFTDQLASARADKLASFISLSGGVGGFARPWGYPAHKLPGLVLWGGPTDNCAGIMKFDTGSMELEQALASSGHALVECVHNCGHAEPPFEAPPGLSVYAGLWQFAFDHPYWLSPGASPWYQGFPPGVPSWCGMGKGSAVPRTGACADPSHC